MLNLFILLCLFSIDLSQAGIGRFDGPERNCSFINPIQNVTYNSEINPHLIGGMDFLVSNNQNGLRFCVTIPEGYEIAITLGAEFSSFDFEETNLFPQIIDAIIITANGRRSAVYDGNLYLDSDKNIKWKRDKDLKYEEDITNITISGIVNWPITNGTDRPSRQFSFYRPFESDGDSTI